MNFSGDLESLKIAATAQKAIIVINKCDDARAELESLLEDTRRQLDTLFNGDLPYIIQMSCQDAENPKSQPRSKLPPNENRTAVSLRR